MPHLPQEVQEQAEAAEGSGFALLEPGPYVVRLADIDMTRSGPAGPGWSWEFDVIEMEDGTPPARSGAKLWDYTSMSSKAAWKVKQVFEAFGVPLDIDTDELIGELAVAVVSQQTQQKGKRQGQLVNNIEELRPYAGSVAEANATATYGDDEPF